MNERIRELAEQALNIVSNKRMLQDGQLERTWDPHDYNRVFAELLVQECIEVSQVGSITTSKLKKHFGFKE